MSKTPILTLALLLGVALATGATHAVTLFTPPLVPEGENQLDCYLVNVSDELRKATIEVLNRNGEVLKSVDVALYPGTEEVATVEADELPRYCKFVVDGDKEHFRGSILVRKNGEGSISALSAE